MLMMENPHYFGMMLPYEQKILIAEDLSQEQRE